jgi:hypothetical protein
MVYFCFILKDEYENIVEQTEQFTKNFALNQHQDIMLSKFKQPQQQQRNSSSPLAEDAASSASLTTTNSGGSRKIGPIRRPLQVNTATVNSLDQPSSQSSLLTSKLASNLAWLATADPSYLLTPPTTTATTLPSPPKAAIVAPTTTASTTSGTSTNAKTAAINTNQFKRNVEVFNDYKLFGDEDESSKAFANNFDTMLASASPIWASSGSSTSTVITDNNTSSLLLNNLGSGSGGARSSSHAWNSVLLLNDLSSSVDSTASIDTACSSGNRIKSIWSNAATSSVEKPSATNTNDDHDNNTRCAKKKN